MREDRSQKLRRSAWKHIYRNLNNNACILILGPNLATGIEKGEEVTLLHHFSELLADELEDSAISYELANRKDLAYIALRWLKNIPNVNSNDLRCEIQDLFGDFWDDIPTIYEQLAQLPISLVINTGMDDYMKQAFEGANKKAHLLHYNYQRNQAGVVPDQSIEEPLIYNLFGYYNDPESMVITKEDQVDYIDGLLKNASTLPKKILKHFDEDKTYLFLGFDMHDWRLPLLFRGLKLHQKASTFYLNEQTSVQAIKDYYKDSFNFGFVDNAVHAFVKELSTGFKKWQVENPRKEQTIAQEMVYINKPQPGVSGKAKVMLMTSSPEDTTQLKLIKEANVVDSVLESGPNAKDFEFKAILNINKRKLLRLLLKHRPQIVHFSGHGTGRAGLVFYGDNDKADLVGGTELANLFRQFSGMISCVLLNACYSEGQAQVIAQYIPNVIATDNAIDDTLATEFSEGFYTALVAGETYDKAFGMATAQVGLFKFPEGGRPVYYKNGQRLTSI
ncbi:MAG: CHAT domain-containing protein [Aureispira sp.]|nr:CHAT domain-containing protein [Aureispira sp.]